MAFIELTNEQLSLLNEHEKRLYEKEYALYKERVAFVEQIERIEKADYKYEKPEFKRIKPVRILELPKYKSEGKYKIVIGDTFISKRKFQKKYNARNAFNQKIKGGLVHNIAISAMPMLIVNIPSLDNIHIDNKKITVRNFPINQFSMNLPKSQTNKIVKPTVQNITVSFAQKVKGVNFDYERKPVRVVPLKVQLPKSLKTISMNAVAIKNIPSVDVNQLHIHKYGRVYNSNSAISDIKSLMKTIKISTPQVKFSPINIKINEFEQVKKLSPGVSINREKFPIKHQIAIKNISGVVPMIPRIKKYKEVQCDVDMPKIKKIKCSQISPIEFVDVVNSINISVSSVKMPTLKEYNEPTCGIKKPEIINIDYPKLKEFKYVETGISTIPNIKLNVPSCSSEEIARLKNRILKAVQGA